EEAAPPTPASAPELPPPEPPVPFCVRVRVAPFVAPLTRMIMLACPPAPPLAPFVPPPPAPAFSVDVADALTGRVLAADAVDVPAPPTPPVWPAPSALPPAPPLL